MSAMKRTMFFALLILCSTSGYAAPEYSVMTFNIRYQNNEDPAFLQWNNRAGVVVNVIRTLNPDIIGFQEVLHGQLQYLTANLAPSGYAVYRGEGRDGGTSGEYNPIFFKSDKFVLVSSDTRWVAPGMPYKPTRGWDAEHKRIVTFVKLAERTPYRVPIFVFNTHLSFSSTTARRFGLQGIRRLVEIRARKYDDWLVDFNMNSGRVERRTIFAPTIIPAVLMGDFNAPPGEYHPWGNENLMWTVVKRGFWEEVGYGHRGMLPLFNSAFEILVPSIPTDLVAPPFKWSFIEGLIWGSPPKAPLVSNYSSFSEASIDSNVSNVALVDWVGYNDGFRVVANTYEEHDKRYYTDANGVVQRYRNSSGVYVDLSDHSPITVELKRVGVGMDDFLRIPMPTPFPQEYLFRSYDVIGVP